MSTPVCKCLTELWVDMPITCYGCNSANSLGLAVATAVVLHVEDAFGAGGARDACCAARHCLCGKKKKQHGSYFLAFMPPHDWRATSE